MRALEVTIKVEHDGTMQVQSPVDLPPGTHAAVLVVDQPVPARPPKPPFPVIDVGPWPSDLSLRREDMYGDDGR